MGISKLVLSSLPLNPFPATPVSDFEFGELYALLQLIWGAKLFTVKLYSCSLPAEPAVAPPVAVEMYLFPLTGVEVPAATTV